MRVTEEALRIQRERVRRPAYWLRWLAVLLIIAGAACVTRNKMIGAPHGTALELAGLALLGLGWALLAVVFVRQRLYDRRRNPPANR